MYTKTKTKDSRTAEPPDVQSSLFKEPRALPSRSPKPNQSWPLLGPITTCILCVSETWTRFKCISKGDASSFLQAVSLAKLNSSAEQLVMVPRLATAVPAKAKPRNTATRRNPEARNQPMALQSNSLSSVLTSTRRKLLKAISAEEQRRGQAPVRPKRRNGIGAMATRKSRPWFQE